MTEHDPAVPLAMLASRLHRASEADFFARLTESGHPGLRMRHPLVLQALEPDGARAGTLAAGLGISQQAAGELVDDLEQRGYVDRRLDPSDRRARLIVLTPRGTEALRQGYAIIAAMEQEYATRIGTDAYRTARSAMSELIDALEGREG